MSTITIPATTEAAVEQLGALGRLINARRWERAAIVTSLVGPAGVRNRAAGKYPLSVVELEALGVVGLLTDKTIANYRDVWCSQRPVPALGEEVDLDGLPEWGTTSKQVTAAVRRKKKAVENAIQVVKADREAIERVLDESDVRTTLSNTLGLIDRIITDESALPADVSDHVGRARMEIEAALAAMVVETPLDAAV